MTSSASLAASPDTLPPTAPRHDGPRFVIQIVGAVAVAHLLNDLIQAVLPAIYPMLKEKYRLSFGQIGWIAGIDMNPSRLIFSRILDDLRQAAGARCPHHSRLAHGCCLKGHYSEWLIQAGKYA